MEHHPSKPKPYQAQLKRGGKQVYLGCFATAEEAALCVARSLVWQPEELAEALAEAKAGTALAEALAEAQRDSLCSWAVQPQTN